MMITAHSGCDSTPDNSLAFVRYALALSPAPAAIEVDVHRRTDGILALAHDSDETGAYAGCPTLSEVLALMRAQPAIGINCDCKDAGLEEQIVRLHAAEAPQNTLLLSGTVSPETLRTQPEILAAATVLLNAEEIVPDFYHNIAHHAAGEKWAAEQAAHVCLACGAQLVNVYYNVCSDVFRSTLKHFGIGVSVWTVNDVDEARAFAAANVFNITTRSAKALLEALRV